MIDMSHTSHAPEAGRNIYDTPAVNQAGESTVPFGIAIVSAIDSGGRFGLTKPTGTETAGWIAFLPGAVVADQKPVTAAFRPIQPVWVQYDSADGTPAPGDMIGPKAGSFKASASGTGLLVLSVITIDALNLAQVLPESGGGGASISIGIVTDVNETAGTATVSDILLKDDYSASPNYQTAVDSRTVPFLKD